MQLLSSYVCASPPLHCVWAISSISSTSLAQYRTLERTSCNPVVVTRRSSDCVGRKKVVHRPRAESQKGVDNEILNINDLRDSESSSRVPVPEREPEAGTPYVGGLSEDEIREALLFEQGGEDDGPRLREADVARGYERTIPISINRGKGEAVASMLAIFGGLLDRPFGSGVSVAAAGSAVIERVKDEIEVLKEEDDVNEQLLFEVIRVIRLLEMDMKLIRAAHKESTLLERLEAARKHCQEVISLANAL